MMTGQGPASDSLFGVKGIHNTTCGSTTYVRSTPHAQIELTENNNDFHTDASLQCELPFRQSIWSHYILHQSSLTINSEPRNQDSAGKCLVIWCVCTRVRTNTNTCTCHTNGSGGIYAKRQYFQCTVFREYAKHEMICLHRTYLTITYGKANV